MDEIIRGLDERRETVGMSKAELARRSHLTAEVVRRLFTASSANPTIGTLNAIADALGVELVIRDKSLSVS